MLSAPPLDNRLVIAGQITEIGAVRYSPAGLPIARFVLEHHSRQVEAAIAREARCRLSALVCGQALVSDLQALAPGTLVRVRGFLSRANYRYGESRLVLHTEQIEILTPSHC